MSVHCLLQVFGPVFERLAIAVPDLPPRTGVLHRTKDEADLIDGELVFLIHSPKEIVVTSVIYQWLSRWGLGMRAEMRGVNGVKDALEGGRGQLTPNAMQRVAENLRRLLLKSARPASASPGPSTPPETSSDDAHIADARP